MAVDRDIDTRALDPDYAVERVRRQVEALDTSLGTAATADVGTGAGQVAAGNHTHTGVYEPVLGNPGVDGYVLSSTAAGVRSWAAAGGGAAWGSITGTLSSQTDLQTALDGKEDDGTAASAISAHEAAANPHPTYLTQAEGDAAYQPLDTQLTSLAGLAYASNALKVVRVNAGESGFELAAPTAGSASATTVEVDLGSTATWRGKFTITDAAISGTSKVLCWQAPGPYTGKGTRADEAELAPVQIIAVEPGSGSAVVKWQTPPIVTPRPNPGAGGQPASAIIPGLKDPQAAAGFIASRISKVRGNVKFTYSVFA